VDSFFVFDSVRKTADFSFFAAFTGGTERKSITEVLPDQMRFSNTVSAEYGQKFRSGESRQSARVCSSFCLPISIMPYPSHNQLKCMQNDLF